MEETTNSEQGIKADTTCTSSNHSNDTTKKNKRKKSRQLHEENYYQGIEFTPIESTGRPDPGHPLRFFSSSHHVAFSKDGSSIEMDAGNTDDSGGKGTKYSLKQIVHRHANGLAVVTAGSTLQNLKQNDDISISSFKFTQEISKSQSVGGKRKRARKMKNKNGKMPDSVEPNDTLAIATLSTGEEIKLKCCIAGTLLEINDRLSLESQHEETDDNHRKDLSLLTRDPLLDGFLAVIMPSSFPSKKC